MNWAFAYGRILWLLYKWSWRWHDKLAQHLNSLLCLHKWFYHFKFDIYILRSKFTYANCPRHLVFNRHEYASDLILKGKNDNSFNLYHLIVIKNNIKIGKEKKWRKSTPHSLPKPLRCPPLPTSTFTFTFTPMSMSTPPSPSLIAILPRQIHQFVIQT